MIRKLFLRKTGDVQGAFYLTHEAFLQNAAVANDLTRYPESVPKERVLL